MEWEMVAGLEIHARIKTQTKMFCRCSNDIFDAEPNTHICPVCAGFPGSLPVINKKALHLGILTALALGCEIPHFSKFDRKSYFYPDLPAGYQISQFDAPVSQNGRVSFFVGKEKKSVRINRLHLENDAGKLMHAGESSLVDLNRAGSPLMEMVTEADFREVEEIPAFLKELQKIIRAVGSSDADMEKGMMRCDVNISLRPKGQMEFGTKTELKNMNSFGNIEKAVRAEIIRQKGILESSGKITQETRGWDVDREVSVAQRSKEEAADYRYFPEPDLPPVVLTDAEIAAIRAEVPELPASKVERFVAEHSISWDNAEILAGDTELSNFFEIAAKIGNPTKVANWIVVEVLAILEGRRISEIEMTAENLGKLVALIDGGKISGKIAKDIFPEVLMGNDPEKIVAERGLEQTSDAGEIEKFADEAISANPQIVSDFRGGKEKALGALVGQMMKLSRGQANPQMANEILRRKLAE